jgi:hypothetical protein
MSSFVGAAPGTQYSGTDLLQGKIPSPGTVAEANSPTGAGRQEYVLCLVAASQNLIDGHLVTIDASTFTVTIAAAGSPAPGNASMLGIARTSLTASASAYIWVQRYGVGSVLATASTLPNVILGMSGATAGQVDDAVTSASAYIAGLHLTATTAATGVTPCFLNYPRFALA